jgi:hypothetical protein
MRWIVSGAVAPSGSSMKAVGVLMTRAAIPASSIDDRSAAESARLLVTRSQ